MAQKIIAFALSLLMLNPLLLVSARIALVQDVTRFQQKIDFEVTGITTPKVVTFETAQYLGNTLSLKNITQNEVINFRQNNVSTFKRWVLPVSDNSNLIEGTTPNIQDENTLSYLSFDTNSATKQITFDNPERLSPSALNLTLAENTQRPQSITIQAMLPGSDQWSNILDKTAFRNQLTFPQIQPTKLRVIFETSNLLRLSELEWTTTNRQSQKKTQISFWAEEGDQFTLFIQPSFGQSALSITQNNPARTDSSTPRFQFPPLEANPSYNPDYDSDGILDGQDLCPRVADMNNTDFDNNGRGDVCEDPDQDGIYSSVDNCPFVSNSNQLDTDNDNLGDACDDTLDQKSENSDVWINLAFGLMVLALLALVARSAWPVLKNKL
jgi:hypothetical protein